MSKKTLWQDMLKIKPTIKLQTAYKRFIEGDPSYFYKETKQKKGKV